MKITEPLKIPNSQIELKIVQDKEKFCYGIDAVLLSKFVLENTALDQKQKKEQKFFDLCTGNAIIPLLLSQHFLSSHFNSIEIQQESFEMAKESIKINELEKQINVIQGDLKNLSELNIQKNSFDFVTVNPPYMNNGRLSENQAKMIARHEIKCTLDDVIKASEFLLKQNGRLFMIHRPNRLSDIFESLKKHNFYVKKLQFIHPTITKEPTMILLECVKNAKCELKVLPPKILNSPNFEFKIFDINF